jgi:hypothetical protein
MATLRKPPIYAGFAERAQDFLSCALRFRYYDEQRFGNLNRGAAGGGVSKTADLVTGIQEVARSIRVSSTSKIRALPVSPASWLGLTTAVDSHRVP